MGLAARVGGFLLAAFLVASMASCGGGGSTASGGSGIGGTGISFVKGNVSVINGQMIASIATETDAMPHIKVVEILVPAALAQSFNPLNIVVSGGNRSTNLDQSGNFELQNVTPSGNFVLMFLFPDGSSVSLPIGAVSLGTTVTVINIKLDSVTGSASSEEVEVEENEDGDSEDSADSEDSEDSGDGTSEEGGATVTICHFPGTPAEETQVIPESSLGGHLGHGDTVGPCENMAESAGSAPEEGSGQAGSALWGLRGFRGQ